MSNNKFTYEQKSSQKDLSEIEKIRNKYLPKNEQELKIEKLKELNNKVEKIPIIYALILGIIGTLIFGLGFSMVLEWNLILWGIVVSIIGFIPTILAYPIYLKIYKKMKEKYSEEILNLTNEILNSEKNNEE